MSDVFLFFMMMVFFGAIGLFVYRNRREIKKWAKDPNHGAKWYPPRETILNRYIEDANAELKWLKENKETPEKEG
jgi:hypothetical protein